jgi:chemotaxis regulatin CheY-phosphate phosphatase CheZ
VGNITEIFRVFLRHAVNQLDKAHKYLRADRLIVKATRRLIYVIYITPEVATSKVFNDRPHTIGGGDKES